MNFTVEFKSHVHKRFWNRKILCNHALLQIHRESHVFLFQLNVCYTCGAGMMWVSRHHILAHGACWISQKQKKKRETTKLLSVHLFPASSALSSIALAWRCRCDEKPKLELSTHSITLQEVKAPESNGTCTTKIRSLVDQEKQERYCYQNYNAQGAAPIVTRIKQHGHL